MRVAIVEDESVVARRLARMVRDIVGADTAIEHAPSLPQAVDLIQARAIDLLFLDLNLNGRDGFDLLEQAAAARFETVIVSAHHDQALRAFEYGVADFVPKPWSEERLRMAIDRARGREPRTRTSRLIVRKGRQTQAIDVEQLLFVQGADDYSELHLADGSTHLHEKTLASLEAQLPAAFARVHRSFIANLSRARAVRSGGGRTLLVFDGGTVVPIGRIYRAEVRERLGM
ncbi:MAG TPA: LytTR family DNA-binding domain-containing protein [Thermoanaerobaculia bacterium]|nr:LytTR family DNA-binding domain-containing protein [Thermoanaerobaculia bacterium]